MGLVRTAAPAVAPISTTEARGYLKIPDEITADDGLIESFIKAGVDCCERVSGRALITQTWRLTLDSFTDRALGYVQYDDMQGWWIELPCSPLQSVTSIAYVDGSGAAQTLAPTEYQVDADSEPGRIRPAYGKTWPTTRKQANAVTITFVAGYGAAGSSVPEEIKDALKAYVSYRNEHREEPDEEFLDRLFRRFSYGALP